jgi:hypothetical protein
MQSNHAKRYNSQIGQVAQLVEQRIENPRVGGSIPPLATTSRRDVSDMRRTLNGNGHTPIFFWLNETGDHKSQRAY